MLKYNRQGRQITNRPTEGLLYDAMNVHEYILQLDTVMSGQQGCTPPEGPLELDELYLTVTQLRARKLLHLLRGAIHVNRRHLSWAAGKCGSSTEQRSNRASLPHDHAEEQ